MVVKNEASQKYQNYLGFLSHNRQLLLKTSIWGLFQRNFKYPSYSHSAEPCPDQAHEDLHGHYQLNSPRSSLKLGSTQSELFSQLAHQLEELI